MLQWGIKVGNDTLSKSQGLGAKVLLIWIDKVTHFHTLLRIYYRPFVDIV